MSLLCSLMCHCLRAHKLMLLFSDCKDTNFFLCGKIFIYHVARNPLKTDKKFTRFTGFPPEAGR